MIIVYTPLSTKNANYMANHYSYIYSYTSSHIQVTSLVYTPHR